MVLFLRYHSWCYQISQFSVFKKKYFKSCRHQFNIWQHLSTWKCKQNLLSDLLMKVAKYHLQGAKNIWSFIHSSLHQSHRFFTVLKTKKEKVLKEEGVFKIWDFAELEHSVIFVCNFQQILSCFVALFIYMINQIYNGIFFYCFVSYYYN